MGINLFDGISTSKILPQFLKMVHTISRFKLLFSNADVLRLFEITTNLK